MVKYKFLTGKITVAILLLIACISCDRDKNNPGYDYFPDMFYSRAYETYAPNPNFADGKTLQAPVEGTISRDAELYPFMKTDGDLKKAAKIKNPIGKDTAVISRGKTVYTNICAQCHGDKADGKGHLFVSGKYPFPPANLLLQKTVNRTEGEIFHIITVGIGVMAPHQIIVKPEDRWKIVLYLKSIQNNVESKKIKIHEREN
jgi:mono/diheme cytochrome c family protein